MARFVTFPGTAGSYASTDDVNLLDADTAHLQQSIGAWVSLNASPTITQSTDLTPVFGTFHGKMALTTTGAGLAGITIGNQTAAVQPSTQYAIGLSVAGISTSEPYEYAVNLSVRDAAGGFLASSTTGFVPFPADGVIQFAEVANAGHASAAFAAIQLQVQTVSTGGRVSGDSFFFDAGILELGASGSFVPSLRIVGDLDIDFDVMVTGLGVQQSFLTRRGTAGNRAFNWFVNASDLMRFQLSSDGTAETSVNSSIAITSAERHLYRVTYLAADGTVSFFQDGAPFGDAGSVAAGGAFPAPKDVEVGTYINGTTAVLDGDVYAGSLKDGIDGPVVCVFDPDDIII